MPQTHKLWHRWTVDFPSGWNTYLGAINSEGIAAGHADGISHDHVFLYRSRCQELSPTSPIPPGTDSIAVYGINKALHIVGSRVDLQGWSHAILLTPTVGKATYDWKDLDIPLPQGVHVDSEAFDINDAGDIVGRYRGKDSLRHGFLLHPGGKAESIDAPAVDGPAADTVATAINTSGTVVGYTYEHNPQIGERCHGFLLKSGVFSHFDYPGATYTLPAGINSAGDIVGTSHGAASDSGFVGQPGSLSPCIYPGANWTSPQGINDAGTIVGGIGCYQAGVGTVGTSVEHGFVAAELEIPDYPFHLESYATQNLPTSPIYGILRRLRIASSLKPSLSLEK
jgi:uncharacterized membrane protein